MRQIKEIEDYRAEHFTCELCGFMPAHIHHIRTRGAGGGNEAGNLIALCPSHHLEIHTVGRHTFAARYGLEERIGAALAVRR
jgi:hypothetical protein